MDSVWYELSGRFLTVPHEVKAGGGLGQEEGRNAPPPM